MRINGQEYNFDRIVRLTIYGAVTGVRADGKEDRPQLMCVEYAPLENPELCARIEAEVKDIPLVAKVNNTAGYTGKITLYNPPLKLRQLIADTMSNLVSYAWGKTGFVRDLQRDEAANYINEYYKKRLRARVEVGYWDPDATGAARKRYSTLIEGYMNSSTYYHKDNDDIMVFTVHDFQAVQQAVDAIRQSFGITCPTERDKKEREIWSLEEKANRSGADIPNSWDAMLQKLVGKFSVFRPAPRGEFYGYTRIDGTDDTIVPAATPGGALIPVSKEDREHYGKWINIIYLFTPKDRETRNLKLKVEMQDLRIYDIKHFYATSSSLEGMINELASYDGAHVGWEIDDYYTDGARTVFVWPLGNGMQVGEGKDADIKIVNYQNLLETPAVGVSGSLTIRMFLNLECQPLKRIALILDDTVGSDTGTGDGLVIRPRILPDASGYERESLSFAGSPSPYTNTIEGSRAQSAYALALSKGGAEFMGYLFNTGFSIQETIHRISTHTNTWETTVKTIPDYGGMYIIPDGKMRGKNQKIGGQNDNSTEA